MAQENIRVGQVNNNTCLCTDHADQSSGFDDLEEKLSYVLTGKIMDKGTGE